MYRLFLKEITIFKMAKGSAGCRMDVDHSSDSPSMGKDYDDPMQKSDTG
jgi:hypothetical protein